MGFKHISEALQDENAKAERLVQDTLRSGQSRLFDIVSQRGVSDSNAQMLCDNARNQFEFGDELCESPIERMMLAALVTADWQDKEGNNELISVCRQTECRPKRSVVITPQFKFGRYRLDFAISLFRNGMPKICGVECDGKEFHKNKIKDDLKSQYFAHWHMPITRFWGAEIHDRVHERIAKFVTMLNWWPDQ